jgi:hypothetical protein
MVALDPFKLLRDPGPNVRMDFSQTSHSGADPQTGMSDRDEKGSMRRSIGLAGALILILSASVFGWSQSPVQDQTEGTATISGRVTLDGKPAPGVVVIATPIDASVEAQMMRAIGRSAAYRATADYDGRFRITGLAAARYKIEPVAPALVYTAANPPAQLSLSDGQTVDDVNFSLSRGGVITGRITDADGRPVIAEKVWVKPVQNTPERPGEPPFGDRMFYTDDRGVYRVYGLSPGQYTVSAGSSGGEFEVFMKRRKLPLTFYPGVNDSSKARVVEVTAGGESVGTDFRIGIAEKSFSVSGVVIDGETQKPVANALVIFERVSSAPSSDGTDVQAPSSPSGVSTASTKGEFKFDSLAPGRYELQANSMGLLSGETEFYSDKTQVEIKNGSVDKLEIRVHRGASISGVVIIENVSDPEILAQLTQLKLTASTDSPAQEQSHSVAAISAEGVFRFTGLRPGRTEISLATYLGPRGFEIKRIEGDLVNDGGIDLQANQKVSGVRIFLVHGSGVIHGQVVVLGDQRQLDTRLLVTAHLRDAVGDGASAFADSKGFFTIQNLPPGDYDVEVSLYARSRSEQPDALKASARQVVSVANEATSEVTFTLDPKSKGNQ